MPKIIIPLNYPFKGSINCDLFLEQDEHTQIIYIKSSFGELITIIDPLTHDFPSALKLVMDDLKNNKYS